MSDVRDIITSVSAETGITLVTVKNISEDGVAKLFDMIAENGVNVDMICFLPSCRGFSDVSFSAKDSDVSLILSAVGKFGNEFSGVYTNVNSENCKLTFSGDEIKKRKGTASFIFRAFFLHNIRIKLITASETKISLLISENDFASVSDMLESVFNIRNV